MITAVGTGWAFLANAASSVAVLAALWADAPGGAASRRRRWRAAAGSCARAFATCAGARDLVVTMILVFVIGTFGLNFQITAALMAKQVFHRSAAGYGLLSTALAVGRVHRCRSSPPGGSGGPSQLFLVGTAIGVRRCSRSLTGPDAGVRLDGRCCSCRPASRC